VIGKDPMNPPFRAPLYLMELLYEFNLEVARRQKEEPALITADEGAEPGALLQRPEVSFPQPVRPGAYRAAWRAISAGQ
jgi:hypothetical protein